MALSKDTPRLYDPAVDPIFADIPGKVSTTFYEGGAVSDDGGNGEADVLTASEAFLGFVERGVLTTATTGEVRVKVRQKGVIKDLPVTGLDANTDLGAAVYAIANDNYTLTSSTTHVQIGKVQHYKGNSGFGDVYFEAAAVRSI